MQQGRITVTTLLQTRILLSAARSYLFTEFQDEHAKPMEEDTTLLHSIVLMYASYVCKNLVVLTRIIIPLGWTRAADPQLQCTRKQNIAYNHLGIYKMYSNSETWA